jgi:Secretion system C-terminal sorting domain
MTEPGTKIKRIMFNLLLFISFAYTQNGNHYNWTPVTSNWSDSLNWSPNGIPDSNDVVWVGVAGYENTTVVVDDRSVGVLNLLSGNMQGITLTIGDSLKWWGGKLEQNVTIFSTDSSYSKISGANVKYFADSAQLISEGETWWDGGKIDFAGNGQPLWTNRGVLHLAPETFGSLQMWSSFFNDSNGMIIKTGTEEVGFRNGFGNSFKNYGHIDIQEGLLWLQTASPISGTVSISGPADFTLDGNNNITVSDLTVTGPGMMHLKGLWNDFTGTNRIEKLRLEGGLLRGAGNLIVSDSLICVSATSVDISTLSIEPQAVLVVDQNMSTKTDTLYLKGKTVFSVNGKIGGSNFATILNRGVMDIIFNDQFNANPISFTHFINEGAGVITINIAAGYNVVVSPKSFTNYGDLFLQSGTLQFNTFGNFYGGKCVFAENTVVDFINGNIRWNDGSEIYGSGTIKSANADIELFGKILPGGNDTGQLTITTVTSRKLKLASSSHLMIQLNGTTAGSEYDQVLANKAMEINGTLQVELGEAFTPAPGDTFDIILYGSHTGVFADTLLPDLPTPGLNLNVIYADSSVRLAVTGTPTGIATFKDEDNIPKYFSLSQNYPNPFNPSTTILYTLPHPGFVSLKIFDLKGREIETLINQNKETGRHSVKFDASNLASGVYFYHLKVGINFIQTKKMLLIE